MQRPIIGITYSSKELDEFTHWQLMFEGVVAAGGVPLAIDCAYPKPHIENLVKRVDGLLISGGGDVDPSTFGRLNDDSKLTGMNPARDLNETTAWRTAASSRIPVLAICRGAQLITMERGGVLYTDIARDFPSEIRHLYTEDELTKTKHTVRVSPASRLSQWLQGATELAVNSQHHQGIRSVGRDCTAVAHSEDGLVEGFEIPNLYVVAVQWHPEVLWFAQEAQLDLLTGFVKDCQFFRFGVCSGDAPVTR